MVVGTKDALSTQKLHQPCREQQAIAVVRRSREAIEQVGESLFRATKLAIEKDEADVHQSASSACGAKTFLSSAGVGYVISTARCGP